MHALIASSAQRHQTTPVFPPVTGLLSRVRGEGTLTLGVDVSTWTDLSGLGNSPVQANAAKRPVGVTGPNGKLAAYFNSSTSDFMDVAIAAMVFPPFTIFIVYKSVSLGGVGTNDFICDGKNNATMGLLSDNTPRSYIYGGTTLLTPSVVANGVYAYETAIFTSDTTSLIRVGGQQVATGSSGSRRTDGYTLGAGGGGVRCGNVEIAEFAIAGAVCSAGEIFGVESYFRSYYAL